MTIDPAQRLQSVYVPVSDGVRLAVDIWLPVGRIARGERVGAAFRATRYHRSEQPQTCAWLRQGATARSTPISRT